MEYNLGDPDQVEQAQREQEEERRRELNDIKTILSNSSGRRFIWRVLNRCHAFNSIYSTDASYMAYSSGQQDLGHFLMSEITEADNNLLLKLMKENRKDQ